jgi:hypothetical protein
MGTEFHSKFRNSVENSRRCGPFTLTEARNFLQELDCEMPIARPSRDLSLGPYRRTGLLPIDLADHTHHHRPVAFRVLSHEIFPCALPLYLS